MIDQPDAPTLLHAMAATLTDQVVPATSGGAQHSARVVANLCRILARDLADGDDNGRTAAALAELLGTEGCYPELVAELDGRIAEGAAPDEIRTLLLADASRRAEIAKPGYTNHEPA